MGHPPSFLFSLLPRRIAILKSSHFKIIRKEDIRESVYHSVTYINRW